MKRVAHYRRRKGRMSGMSEKCCWYLAKNNNTATGSELAAMLKISLVEFNLRASALTRTNMVASITASETWKTESGIVDRRFTLVRKPRYVAPAPGDKQRRQFTQGAVNYAAKNMRQECIEKAVRRRRLIIAGLYINEFEAVL